MSQAKISNFFPLRKRGLEAEPPSKKRKLVNPKDVQIMDFLSTKEPTKEVLKESSKESSEDIIKEKVVFKTPVKETSYASPVRNPVGNSLGNSSSISRKLKFDETSSSSSSLSSPSKLKLTPSEIRSKLGKVGKLSELQSRLKAISSPVKNPPPPSSENDQEEKKKQEIANRRKVPAYRRFADLVAEKPELSRKEVQLNVPKSPLKCPASPLKLASPRKNLPCHERFHDLAQPQETKYLPIPTTYRLLSKMFSSLDQVISMKFNRGEAIRVMDLKQPVQNVVRTEFKDLFLEQIRCVFPAAYKLSWEKKKGKFGHYKEEYELHIQPNLEYKKDAGGRNDAPTKRNNLDAVALVERKNIFNNTLLSMTMDHHREFLGTLDPPISVKDEKLMRWHREFDPNLHCPEIDKEPFPVKPEVETFTSAKEVMQKAQEIFAVNPRLENAMKKHVENEAKKEAEEEEEEKKKAMAAAQVIPDRFKGLNPNLVKKILAKEKEKLERELIRNPKEVEELEMIKELPQVCTFSLV